MPRPALGRRLAVLHDDVRLFEIGRYVGGAVNRGGRLALGDSLAEFLERVAILEHEHRQAPLECGLGRITQEVAAGCEHQPDGATLSSGLRDIPQKKEVLILGTHRLGAGKRRRHCSSLRERRACRSSSAEVRPN